MRSYPVAGSVAHGTPGPGPLGPLMAARVRQGVLPPDVREEDVVVIRGQAPTLHARAEREASLHV